MLDKLGIQKITHQLPFRLNHVHTFLGEGEAGHRIIDTGLHTNETASLWRDALEDKTLETIILSHLHPDHTGYAGALQEATNAQVWMSKRDATDLSNVWSEESLEHIENTFYLANVPNEITKNLTASLDEFIGQIKPLPRVDKYLQEGDVIKFGHYTYDVYEVPGHAAGLVCFYQKETDVLLSMDHILPKITPNIAYWFYGEKNPLQSYYESLMKIRKLNAGYVIPSHREPFEGANVRIDEIWQHHEDRLNIVLKATKEPLTVFEVCQKMFDRQLSDYDYQFAIGETLAHLIYLEEKGEIFRGKEFGRIIFYQK